MTNFIFVHKGVSKRDREVFEPLTDNDKILEIEENKLLEHLMVKAGLFSSLTQARKNNWAGYIPSGYRIYRFGKKHTIETLNSINPYSLLGMELFLNELCSPWTDYSWFVQFPARDDTEEQQKENVVCNIQTYKTFGKDF